MQSLERSPRWALATNPRTELRLALVNVFILRATVALSGLLANRPVKSSSFDNLASPAD